MLTKHALSDCKPAKTPVSKTDKLDADPSGTTINPSLYRGMIGSLLYLTASRPDIMFATILCAHFQANPKESHLIAVKRIFRYLKHTPRLALWYHRDSAFDLYGYTDSDYAGCNIDKKSTSGGCHFLGSRLISWSSKKQTSVAIRCNGTDKPNSWVSDYALADRKSTRLNSSHSGESRMPSSA